MKEKYTDIEIITGSTDILIVAPHGVETKPYDDENTAELARSIAKQLKCSAIINSIYRKPSNNEKPDIHERVLDLNNIPQSKEHPDFIKNIKKVADSEGQTFVLWVHGMDDASAEKEARESAFNDNLHALIGYGQGPKPTAPPQKKDVKDQENRITAKKETATRFEALLTKHGLTTILTRDNAPNFRGHSPKNMNQWFLNERYHLSEVESLQLEIRKKDFRGENDVENTAKIISNALSELINPPVEKEAPTMETAEKKETLSDKSQASSDVETGNETENQKLPMESETVEEEDKADEALVGEVYDYLSELFVQHFHETMLKVGRYIIKNFYNNDNERARNKKSVKTKSLNALISKLQKDRSGNTPSKTWIYDAVNLVVDEDDYTELSVYGKLYKELGHSHKVNLTYVKDPKVKSILIEEAVENKYTVAQLKERIAEEKKKSRTLSISIEDRLTNKQLKEFQPNDLKSLKRQAEKKIKDYNDKLEDYKKKLKNYKENLNKIEKVLES